MAVMMKWLSFITFFSLNPPQFIRGGVPRHNNAKTHFHGSPHCRMSVKAETTDFLCRRTFWKGGGKETTDSFISNDFTVLLRGGRRGVEAAWLLLARFNSAYAGAWLIAGVALASTILCPLLSTHTHKNTLRHLVFCIDISQVLRE